jgi:hypothetical protein
VSARERTELCSSGYGQGIEACANEQLAIAPRIARVSIKYEY